MVQEMQAVRVSRQIKTTPKAAYRMFASDMAFREWLSDGAYVQSRDGGRILLTWNAGHAVVGTYRTRKEGEQIAFTWQVVGEPEVSLITVNFESDGDDTRVTLTHDGATTGPNGREAQASWDAAFEVLEAVLERGDDIRFTRRPMLGIMVGNLDDAAAQRLGLEKAEGILLSSAIDGMGAGAAGLTKDDVILSMDGKPTPDYQGLVAAIGDHRAGDTVEVEYWRDNALHKTNLTFSKRPIPEVPANPNDLADAVQLGYDKLNAELEQILEGVSEAEADHCPADGEWNVKEVVVHLLTGERGTRFWLGTLLTGDETIAYVGNVSPPMKAFLDVYPTLPEIVAAFRREQAEIVALLRRLPEDIVANTPTYTRIGLTTLQEGYHPQDHFEQIKQAIASARGQ